MLASILKTLGTLKLTEREQKLEIQVRILNGSARVPILLEIVFWKYGNGPKRTKCPFLTSLSHQIELF
jgi:hypothetical protein